MSKYIIPFVIIVLGLIFIAPSAKGLSPDLDSSKCPQFYRRFFHTLEQKILMSGISSNLHFFTQSSASPESECIVRLISEEIENVAGFSQSITSIKKFEFETSELVLSQEKADRLPLDFIHFTPWNKLNFVIINDETSLEKLIAPINHRATKLYYRDYTVLWQIKGYGSENFNLLQSKLFENLKYKVALSPSGEALTSMCFYCENGEPKPVSINPDKREPLFLDYTKNFHYKTVRFVGGLGIPLLMDFSQNPLTGEWSPKSGFMIKPILFHLQEKLNFTLTTRVFKVYGAELPNGSFTGFLNELHQGRADLGLAGQSIHRIRAVHFTVPLYIDSVSFAIRIPKTGIKWEAIFQAFQLKTWILFFCICGFGVLPIYVYIRRDGLKTGIFFILRPVLEQDLTRALIPQRSFSGKMLMIVWLLGTLIIGVAYKSKLTSLMVLPGSESCPDSFDQLASSKYQIILHQVGGALSRNVYSTSSNIFQSISRRMKLQENMYECLEKVYKVNDPPGACITYKHNIIGEIYRNWTNHYGHSPLTMAPAYAFMTAGSYFIPKTAVYRESIETVISRLVSTGFADWAVKEAFGSVLRDGQSWSKKVKNSHLYPRSGNNENSEGLKLQFQHLKAAFNLLLFNSGFCIFVFVCEKVYSKVGRHRTATFALPCDLLINITKLKD